MTDQNDFLDAHGRAVHRFALDVANLGLARLGEEMLAMLESGAWREFTDGLGTYRFLEGEFDYFLSQQGVDRDQVMQGIRDVKLKARLEAVMDERRTGDSAFRRRLEDVRTANPQRPGRPVTPFGYSRLESKVLVADGALAKSSSRPSLGSAVRRFTTTGGVTTRPASKDAPLHERLARSAKRLSDDELGQLIDSLRSQLRSRHKGTSDGHG